MLKKNKTASPTDETTPEAAVPGAAGPASEPAAVPVPEPGSTPGTPPAGEAPGPEADHKAQIEQLTDRWLRSKADLENYRKRVQRELAEIRDQTTAAVVREFLPVLDQFEMALAHADAATSHDALLQGIRLTLTEFQRALSSLGVSAIETQGQPFDPREHEAMAQQPSVEVPAGHILQQWKGGYRLGDRVLRPAAVIVSAGAPPASAAEAQANG